MSQPQYLTHPWRPSYAASLPGADRFDDLSVRRSVHPASRCQGFATGAQRGVVKVQMAGARQKALWLYAWRERYLGTLF